MLRDAFGGGEAVGEAAGGEDEFMRPLGFFVLVGSGGGLGEGARFGGCEKNCEFGGEFGFGAESEDEGGLFAAVDGGPVPGFDGLRPGVIAGRKDGKVALVEVMPVDIEAMTAP